MMEVSLDSTKTDVHMVEMAIAKVGHDTDMHRATDEVYNSLPATARLLVRMGSVWYLKCKKRIREAHC